MIFRREPYRIFIVFILLFLIMGVCLWYMAGRTNDAIQESVRTEIQGVATVIAEGIDGDSLALFRPGDEQTPAFIQMRDHLNRLRSDYPSLSSIYTMRKGETGIEFVVDADYGITSNAPGIGEPYPEANGPLLNGFLIPSADREFTTDKWGVVLSGYAPVKDRNGNTVGIVGVDIDSSRLIARQQFIQMNFLFIALLFLIIMASGLAATELVRSRSLQELGERKEYLDTLLNAVPAGIIVINAATKQIVDLNEPAAVLLGLTRDEICGHVCHEFICPAETGKCPITDLGQSIDNAERVLCAHDGTKIPILKTVRKVTLKGTEYLVESFQEMPDKP